MTYLTDYSLKAQGMDYSVEEINTLISFFNYCFINKNSFTIPSFNPNMIHYVYLIYNKTKTNILTPNTKELFFGLEEKSIKLLRYILHNVDPKQLPSDIHIEHLNSILMKLKSSNQ